MQDSVQKDIDDLGKLLRTAAPLLDLGAQPNHRELARSVSRIKVALATGILSFTSLVGAMVAMPPGTHRIHESPAIACALGTFLITALLFELLACRAVRRAAGQLYGAIASKVLTVVALFPIFSVPLLGLLWYACNRRRAVSPDPNL